MSDGTDYSGTPSGSPSPRPTDKPGTDQRMFATGPGDDRPGTDQFRGRVESPQRPIRRISPTAKYPLYTFC